MLVERVRVPFAELEGQVVSAEGTFAGTHTGTLRTPQGEIPPTQQRVELRWSATCELRGEELVSEHLYFDQLELLAHLRGARGLKRHGGSRATR